MSPRNPPNGSPSQAKRDRYQLSLMHVFRAAHADRDTKKAPVDADPGQRTLSQRSKERRHGTDEATLRRHLTRDLASLLNTVNLDATVPLDDHPYVAKSIVNYGFGDMGRIASSEDGHKRIAREIKETLCRYEARLIPETVEVTVAKAHDIVTNRLTFEITAEMTASPVDIPLQFLAELDDGVGKIQMTRLQVKT